MKPSLLLLVVLSVSATGFTQKNITCKKGDVKQNGQLIAEYDGVGSIFKLVKLGVFAPGTKDTLISVTEESFDPQNPLFPDLEVVYKLQFKNTSLAPFYVSNLQRKGVRFLERDAMEMVFNDSVPVLVAGGKLDEAAVEQFRGRYAYNYEAWSAL